MTPSISIKERLREKPGGRAIVLVGIADLVRVKLDLAVVEVEVRGVRKLAISARIYCLCLSAPPEVKIN